MYNIYIYIYKYIYRLYIYRYKRRSWPCTLAYLGARVYTDSRNRSPAARWRCGCGVGRVCLITTRA